MKKWLRVEMALNLDSVNFFDFKNSTKNFLLLFPKEDKKILMNICVKKFGGTSVGSIERILAAAGRIYEDYKSGEKIVVVVSAMSGETNRLIQMAQSLDASYRGPAYDMLLASGEQVSVSLLSIALNKMHVPAVPLLAHQMGIQTDALFSSARIRKINTKLILKLVSEGKIPLVAGFQGVTQDGQITTLGRGGSDTTAVALAAALKQPYCEIYTDVSHIYTADPRVLKTAKKLLQLSFEEMMEMAVLGAKVLHFRSVELAAKFNVKIHLKSTFEKTKGTWIIPKEEIMENPVVSAVTSDMRIAVIKLFPIPKGTKFISTVFDVLAEKSIPVDVISQSYNSEGQRLAFSIKEEDVDSVVQLLSQFKDKMTVVKGLAKVSIVGVGMAHHSGVAAKFFSALNQCSVDLHLTTTSEIKISAVVNRKHATPLIEQLHHQFFPEKK